MSWEILLLTSATTVLADFAVALAKKSPPYLIAPFVRLWKECSLLHGMLQNERFSNWKPQAARYVALQAIKVQGANQETPQPVLDVLDSFLKRSEPVVLLGEPGAGKTTVLEALTYRAARRALLYDRLIWLALLIVTAVLSFAAPIFTLVWLASFILWEPLVRRFTVPLFIEARSDYSGGEVNDWCEKIFQDRLGAKPLIGSRRRVAILIDGVNEVQGSLFDGFVEGWRARLRDKPACRVIFTSRGGEESPSESLSIESVHSVCDLDDDGVLEFLKVYGQEKADDEKRYHNLEQAERDFDELKKKNLLGKGSIGRNPYWLKMIVESGLYTINRGALFHSFSKKLIRREIREKPKKRERSPEWKIVPIEVEMDALGALALAMHEEKRIGFTDETGWSRARAAIRESIGDLPYSPDDVLGEGQASTLVRLQFKKRVEFVHQLVQEFFAAYALRPESKWQEALAHWEDFWWWQTLFHLGGLIGAESPEFYDRFVRKILDDGSSEERVFAAIGLLRSVDRAKGPYDKEQLLMVVSLVSFRNNLTNTRPTDVIVPAVEERGVDFAMTPQLESEFRLKGANPQIIQAIGANYRGATSQLPIEVIEAFGRLMERRLILREGATTLDMTDAPLRAVHALTAALGEEASETFGMLLEHPRNEIQIIGILILSIVRNKRAAELVVRKLRRSSIVKWVGIRPLVDLGTSAVEPLIFALEDEQGEIEPVLEALVNIGASSVGPLIIALGHRNSAVAGRAAIALGRIGDTQSVEPLFHALRREEEFVRIHAADALGRIRDPRAVAPLIAALAQEDDHSVRWSLEMALIQIGQEAVEGLITALWDRDSRVRLSVAQALRYIRDPIAVKPLVVALRDRNTEVSTAALEALVEIGAPSVEPLIAALREEYAETRRLAAGALGRIGDARALDELDRIAAVGGSNTRMGSDAYSALEAAKTIRKRLERGNKEQQ